MAPPIDPPAASSHRRPLAVGALCGIAAASLFAGKGILIRLAYGDGATVTSLLAWRMVLSLPCFAMIAWWYARRDGNLSRADHIHLLLLGVLGYHVASWLDFAGLHYIDVALERVVLFLYPTLVVGWALLRGKQRIDRRLLIGLAATYLGILLTWGDRLAIHHPLTTAIGVGLVAASAVAFAVHLVLVDDLIARIGGIRAMSVAMVGACITCVIHALISDATASLHPLRATIIYGALLAMLATVVPVLLAAVAVQHLGAARAAVLGAVAPALTALLGWAVLHEELYLLGWLGIVATMVGALLAARPRAR